MTGQVSAAEIRLEGQVHSGTFLDWICHRAHLLNLNGWVKVEGPEEISIVVQGPQALIDAMEMACSLGPMDVCVEQTEVLSRRPNRQLNGFKKL